MLHLIVFVLKFTSEAFRPEYVSSKMWSASPPLFHILTDEYALKIAHHGCRQEMGRTESIQEICRSLHNIHEGLASVRSLELCLCECLQLVSSETLSCEDFVPGSRKRATSFVSDLPATGTVFHGPYRNG